MAANAKQPARLGGNGWKAMQALENSLLRLAVVERLTQRLDVANEHGNYRLVTALNAEIRGEVATVKQTLGDAARGVYQ